MANFTFSDLIDGLAGLNSTNLTLSGFIALGASPAQSGELRLSNVDSIVWRNIGDNGDNIMLSINASDALIIGESTTSPFVGVVPELRCFGILDVTIDSTAAFQVLGANLTPIVFTVDTTTPLIIATGAPIQGSVSTSYALLDESSTLTNPTLIPRRDELTTGIGGFPEMGDPGLSLIVDGVQEFSIRQSAAVFATSLSVLTVNTLLHVRGQADNLTLLVRGHTTQTDDLARFESGQAPAGRRVVITNDGDLSAYGGLAVRNVDEGGVAETIRTSVRERHTLALSTTSVTTGISVPSGARLLGVSFNVDGAVIDDGGNDTWSALFSGGSSTVLATAAAAAQNTKVDLLIVDEISTGVVEVTFNPNGGSFTAGIIDIIVYYEVLVSMANN